MELQWPLILFTTFVAWSAGLFSAQSVHAIKGEAQSAQMRSLVCSAGLLVIGGISVFFHLQHWERIFNGFGHITSGITQELIVIVAILLLMVATFASIRRSQDGGFSRPLAIVNIAMSAILVIVMGHSYLMPARPTWDTVAEIISLLGNGAALGVATFALIRSLSEKVTEFDRNSNVAGTIINAVTTCLYIGAAAMAASSFSQVGRYFDPIHATNKMVAQDAYSPFAGETMVSTAIAIIAALAAIAVAVVFKKKDDWKAPSAIIIACSIVAAVALRVTFYLTGGSVYPFY